MPKRPTDKPKSRFKNRLAIILKQILRLISIKDNYPKYVISMTPLVKRRDRQGITHLGLREFLKNGF